MDREGEGSEYDSYHISRETEEIWNEVSAQSGHEAEESVSLNKPARRMNK